MNIWIRTGSEFKPRSNKSLYCFCSKQHGVPKWKRRAAEFQVTYVSHTQWQFSRICHPTSVCCSRWFQIVFEIQPARDAPVAHQSDELPPSWTSPTGWSTTIVWSNFFLTCIVLSVPSGFLLVSKVQLRSQELNSVTTRILFRRAPSSRKSSTHSTTHDFRVRVVSYSPYWSFTKTFYFFLMILKPPLPVIFKPSFPCHTLLLSFDETLDKMMRSLGNETWERNWNRQDQLLTE